MKLFSLRWFIIVPFILLMLISGITVYLFSTITITNVARNVGMQYIKEVENRIYDRVIDFTAPLVSIIEINRNAFSYHPELLDDLASVAGRLYEQAVPYPHMTFVSVATTDGRYLASTRDPIGKVQHSISANYVNKALTMEGFEYDPIRFIGAKIETDPSFSYDPRTRPFYLDAVNNKGMAWTRIVPYYGLPTLGIGLSAPIYSQQGALLGVTATSIALIELDEYLQSIDLVDNGYVFIAEENGALIASSEEDELYSITEHVTTRVTLATHAEKVLQAASKLLVSGIHHLDVDGEDFLYEVQPVSFAFGKTWLIGTLIPNAHHKNLLTEYTQATVIITLLLFACIALVGSLVAYYIGMPIRQLNLAANDRKLASILQLPQPLCKIREINSLSQGLHVMADNLSDIMHNLEQKVAQRTSYLKDENDHLMERSITDELTEIYNRRGFNQVFKLALNDAETNHQSLTFVICDIDHFKHINDQFGHAAGDLALVAVARILKRHLRSQDIVARYGGEEFALVIVGAEVSQVISRLNQIRQSFLAKPVFEEQHVTMSFGVTHSNDVATTTPEKIINEADEKLYQAKNSGRDRIIS